MAESAAMFRVSLEAAVEVPAGSERVAYDLDVLVSAIRTSDAEDGASGPADVETRSAGARAGQGSVCRANAVVWGVDSAQNPWATTKKRSTVRHSQEPPGRHVKMSMRMDLAASTHPMWSSADVVGRPLRCMFARTTLQLSWLGCYLEPSRQFRAELMAVICEVEKMMRRSTESDAVINTDFAHV